MQKKLGVLFALGLLIVSTIIGGCNNMQTNAPVKTDFPTKPITLIVPASAGGGLDLQARILEKLAPKYLNQPLTIVNKPGGGSTIGLNELASSSPDGYTMGMSGTGLILQPLFGPTKYHYPTALEPLAQLTTQPNIMVVNAEQPWQSLADLIQYGKQQPHSLKLGHSGIGSNQHIVSQAFMKSTNIELDQVPFSGGSEIVSALLGNHIQIAFVNPSVVKEQIKAGKLKALAITAEQRLLDPELAQIPTFKELDLDIVFTTWYGVVVPKGLPPEVRAKLEEALKAMISDPAFKENEDKLGLPMEYLNSEDLKKRWLSDGELLTKMVTETGIIEQIRAQKK